MSKLYLINQQGSYYLYYIILYFVFPDTLDKTIHQAALKCIQKMGKMEAEANAG